MLRCIGRIAVAGDLSMLRILLGFGLLITCSSCSRALRYEDIPINQVLRELDEVYGFKITAETADFSKGRAAQQMISSGEFVIARIDASHKSAQEFEQQIIRKGGYTPSIDNVQLGEKSVEWWPKSPSLARTYHFSPFPDQNYHQAVILLQFYFLTSDEHQNVILIKMTPKEKFLRVAF